MVVMWLIDKLRNLWWWARGVTNETYTTRCTRCGYNGRIHLVGCGCRRFVPPDVGPDDSEGVP